MVSVHWASLPTAPDSIQLGLALNLDLATKIVVVGLEHRLVNKGTGAQVVNASKHSVKRTGPCYSDWGDMSTPVENSSFCRLKIPQP